MLYQQPKNPEIAASPSALNMLARRGQGVAKLLDALGMLSSVLRRNRLRHEPLSSEARTPLCEFDAFALRRIRRC
jgi:hypothetical protein